MREWNAEWYDRIVAHRIAPALHRLADALAPSPRHLKHATTPTDTHRAASLSHEPPTPPPPPPPPPPNARDYRLRSVVLNEDDAAACRKSLPLDRTPFAEFVTVPRSRSSSQARTTFSSSSSLARHSEAARLSGAAGVSLDAVAGGGCLCALRGASTSSAASSSGWREHQVSHQVSGETALLEQHTVLEETAEMAVPRGVGPEDLQLELNQMLSSALLDEWDFDALRLHTLTGGRPMSALGWAIFEHLGLRSAIGIECMRLKRFLARVEAGYNTVPYHNSAHACCVTHAATWILSSSENLGGVAPDADDMLAVVVAALVHDLGHDGKSNALHCESNSPLAIRYAYQSVLERHHLASAFEILACDDCNILHSLPLERRRAVRDLVVGMVLATDFGEHTRVLADFQSLLDREMEVSTVGPSGHLSGRESSASRSSAQQAAMPARRARTRAEASPAAPLFCSLLDFGLDVSAEGNVGAVAREQYLGERLTILQVVLKAADLANLTKELHYCLAFTDRVLEEFWQQGDAKKQLGLPVSAGFDRERVDAAAAEQLAFVRFAVYPLFEALDKLVPLSMQLERLDGLISHWEGVVLAKDAVSSDG